MKDSDDDAFSLSFYLCINCFLSSRRMILLEAVLGKAGKKSHHEF